MSEGDATAVDRAQLQPSPHMWTLWASLVGALVGWNVGEVFGGFPVQIAAAAAFAVGTFGGLALIFTLAAKVIGDE